MQISFRILKVAVATAVVSGCLGGFGVSLPVEYQAVEYVESTGTQYIRTGVLTQNCVPVIDVRFQFTDVTGGPMVVGVYGGERPGIGSVGTTVGVDTRSSGPEFRFRVGGDVVYCGSVDTNYHEVLLNGPNGTTLDNEVVSTSLSGAQDVDGLPELFAFALNELGRQKCAKVRLYRLVISLDGEKVRDFVPCYEVGEGGRVGLYDLVGEQFYANAGSGEFLKGEDIFDFADFSGLLVDGDPGKYGTVEPTYGSYPHKKAGDEQTCWAEPSYAKGGVGGKLLGWVLYTNSLESAEWQEWRRGDSATCAYIQPTGIGVRLVWQWTAFRLSDEQAVPNQTGGGFTVSANLTGVADCGFGPLHAQLVWWRDQDRMVYTNDLGVVESDAVLSESVVANTIPSVRHYAKFVLSDADGVVRLESPSVLEVVSGTLMTDGLPAAYQQVEYIEATGTQYIKTGIIFNGAVPVIEAKFQFRDLQNDKCAFGIWQTGYGAGAMTGLDSGQIRYRVGKTAYYYGAADLNVHEIKFNGPEGAVIDGAVRNAQPSGVAEGSTIELYALSRNSNGSVDYSKVRLFGLKIDLDGLPARDFVPCYELGGDRRVGLYDLVGKKFYPNDGTGEFLKGKDVLSASTLIISGVPNEYGAVDPAYGTYSGLSAGLEFDCHAPETYSEGTTHSACTGWMLYTNAQDSAEWCEWKSGAGKVCHYQHPEGTSAKLVWQWSVMGEQGLNEVSVVADEQGGFNVSAYVTGVGYEADNLLCVQVAWGRSPDNLIYTNEIATVHGAMRIAKSFHEGVQPNAPHFAKVFATDKHGDVVLVIPEDFSFTTCKQVVSRLPEGYRQLEYLESTGTQYINTGIRSQNRVPVVDFKFQFTDSSSGAMAFGIYNGGGTTVGLDPKDNNSGLMFRFRVANTVAYFGAADTNYHEVLLNGPNGTIFDGEVVPGGPSGVVEADANKSWYAFALNNGLAECAKVRIYGLKASFDGVMLRDFIPCREEGGQRRLGLYDLILNEFLTNAGTGEFIAGPDALGADTLEVVGSPEAFGMTDPGYRLYTGFAEGAVFDCFAPAGFTNATKRATCTGWIVYGKPAGQTDWTELRRGTGTVCPYVHPSMPAKLVWQWDTEYLVDVMAGEGGDLKVNGGECIKSFGGWMKYGSAYEIVAVPTSDSAPNVCWTGTVLNERISGARLNLVVDAPQKVEARFVAAPVRRWAGGFGEGEASDARNWADGAIPADGDLVTLAGTADGSCPMLWDLVSVRPSGWLQTDTYDSAVTVATTYPNGGFPVLAIDGDVEIANGVWTHRQNVDGEAYRLSVAVAGDFTLGEAGAVDVAGKGCTVGLEHASYVAGGSVVCPTNCGNSAVYSAGGGAVRLTVGGKTTIDGCIDACGADVFEHDSGAGGSVWLTTGEISGSGRITADGGRVETANHFLYGGAGGRIALELRKSDAGFSELDLAKVTANPGVNSAVGLVSTTDLGSVYLKAGRETFGTAVFGDGEVRTIKPVAVLPSVGPCLANELKRIKIQIRNSIVKLTNDLTVGDFAFEGADGMLDLDGHLLNVKSTYHDYPALQVGNAGEWIEGRSPNYRNIKWLKPGLVIFLH